MLDFLKKLFSVKNRDLTVVVLDDQEPESSNTYKFRPEKLMVTFYLAMAGVAALVLLLVMFTPLGSLVYNQEDEELREAVIGIQQRVEALKDSLEARDMQLAEIQEVLALGADTTFSVSPDIGESYTGENELSETSLEQVSPVNTPDMITQNEIIFSGLLKNAPQFPASYPVDGTLTRGYNPVTGHYGIDIATKENSPFRAIADGAVVNQDWTVNYGYVVYIQHSNGLISVYKHASSTAKSAGDIILKGDILGTVGDSGVLSSGPHLHLEIWKNGVPQNPVSYLIKS